MSKKNLKKFLILFAIFIALNSCCSDPEIIYRDPPPPIIPNMIDDPDLEDTVITVNEYRFMVYSFRVKILYKEILKNVKLITDDEYQSFVSTYMEKIELINAEIDKLELLD